MVLHVGSFTAPKNHEGLLQIMERLARQRKNLVLVMVGDGTRRESISRLAEAIPNLRTIAAGLQLDVWPYYFAADLLLFPSTSEGLGNVLLEGQAAGLPIVASDIAAHREALAKPIHANLFELPDYRQAAALALARLSRPILEQIEAGRRHVEENYSISKLVRDTSNIYRKVLKLEERSERPRTVRVCE